MKFSTLFLSMILCTPSLFAATDADKTLHQEVKQLQQESLKLQHQVNQLNHQLTHHAKKNVSKKHPKTPPPKSTVRDSRVYVHELTGHPESLEFYPTALLSDNQVVTFIAGTPVVTAPYLGSRPAFDGSDYIVNISSINRDIRLMQQRRTLYNAYRQMGYPIPNTPIITISGKVEPIAALTKSYRTSASGDFDLGSAELDTAASVNETVQAYFSLAYNPFPAAFTFTNQRVAQSSMGLGMGFINVGDLNKSPFYFTAGQLFAPFGRYSNSMVSSTLPMIMSRTKTRPFILGYKSQGETGPFAAIYGFRGDTTLGNAGAAGVNAGYIFSTANTSGEIGASLISSIDNAGGMQANGSGPSNFGGFASTTNGSEAIKEIPAVDVHGNIRIDRYNFTAEWVGATEPFRAQDLSFNGVGAQPQALQLEAAATFKAFTKPATLAVGYQWSKETLALRLPEQRISGVFNISIWKDTVESLEYRHDIDFNRNQYANGAAPSGSINANTLGTGHCSDTVLAQIGVYF